MIPRVLVIRLMGGECILVVEVELFTSHYKSDEIGVGQKSKMSKVNDKPRNDYYALGRKIQDEGG